MIEGAHLDDTEGRLCVDALGAGSDKPAVMHGCIGLRRVSAHSHEGVNRFSAFRNLPGHECRAVAGHKRIVNGVADALVNGGGPTVIAGTAFGDPERLAGIFDKVPEPAGRRGRHLSSDAIFVAVSGEDIEGRQCPGIVL